MPAIDAPQTPPGDEAREAAPRATGRPVDPLRISTSYYILRNGVAVVALAIPVALLAGAGLDAVQGSLSAYYHFSSARPDAYGAGTMRDVFVGALCAIGAFLLFYRGYSRAEDIALNVAGVAAVLIALVPMDWPAVGSAAMSAAGTLHYASAATFFVMIGYVCVFRARDTLRMLADAAHRRRFERIYLTLGVLMAATPAVLLVLHVALPRVQGRPLELLIEIAGIYVFAAFWLVKGYEIRVVERELVLASGGGEGKPCAGAGADRPG